MKEENLTIPGEYRMVQPNMDASFISISKYDKMQPQLDEQCWLLAGEWTKMHFMPFMSGSRLMSEDDVLMEMDKTTSCGYPWNLQYKNKNDFLDSHSRSMLSDFWEHMILPENEMVPIWTCSQKVEIRSVEKLKLNKIRTFTACPIELSVATNRLCLDMNNNFYLANNKTFSCVGMTKYLGGWDHLYHRLNKHPNAFELDESEYDSSIFVRALTGQRDIRLSFLREPSDDDIKRMHFVYDSIINSVIVLENGELIQKQTGNPSGSSNTVVDNTMILFRLFCYAWIVIKRRMGIPLGHALGYSDFVQNVEAALYGDDNTFTVSNSVVSFFNAKTVAQVWSEIGVITKSPCWEPRLLEKVSFLSQAFYKDRGMWFPVPETARVLDSLMYGSDVDDVRWHYLRACALRMDSYGNVECRTILSNYINYLNKKYSTCLVGTCKMMPMHEIRLAWKSDDFIDRLYRGLESSEACKYIALL